MRMFLLWFANVQKSRWRTNCIRGWLKNVLCRFSPENRGLHDNYVSAFHTCEMSLSVFWPSTCAWGGRRSPEWIASSGAKSAVAESICAGKCTAAIIHFKWHSFTKRMGWRMAALRIFSEWQAVRVKMKNQVRSDNHTDNLSARLLRVDTDLMIHKQSMNMCVCKCKNPFWPVRVVHVFFNFRGLRV